MKKAIYLLLVCLTLSCNTDQPPILEGTENQFNFIDTTYVQHWEEDVFASNDRVFLAEVPILDTLEKAIRFHRRSGWGSFEFICTIYNSPDPIGELYGKKSVYYKDKDGEVKEDKINIFRSKKLSAHSIDSLFQVLEMLGIDQMEMDLPQEYECDDCGSITLAIKNKEYKKAIFWNFVESVRLTSQKEKIVMDTYRKFFEFMDFPIPVGILHVYKVTQDSTTYEYGIMDDNILDVVSIELTLKEPILSFRHLPPMEYAAGFKVANVDTSSILDKIQMYGIQELGDTVNIIKIKKMKLQEDN